MVDPVLLEGPGVEYSDFHMPHAGDGVQNHFVPPEVSLKQQLQILLVGQRWGPTSA